MCDDRKWTLKATGSLLNVINTQKSQKKWNKPLRETILGPDSDLEQAPEKIWAK